MSKRLRWEDATPGLPVRCVEPPVVGFVVEEIDRRTTYVVRAQRPNCEDIYIEGLVLSYRASRFVAVEEKKS